MDASDQSVLDAAGISAPAAVLIPAPAAGAGASAPMPVRVVRRLALEKPFWRIGGLGRRLLYGEVDRAVKTRARLGLAVLIFGIGYSVIAARLLMLAAAPDSQISRRSNAADAVATARPDILDRTGEILATDIRMPSLFAEPHRIIDVDDAVELLTTVLPDVDATELRLRLSSRRRFVWLKRDIT